MKRIAAKRKESLERASDFTVCIDPHRFVKRGQKTGKGLFEPGVATGPNHLRVILLPLLHKGRIDLLLLRHENIGDRNGVTLPGLLNVLDGFYAPTNVLFMMTTNRIETLDEALLRPGRIDYRLYLGRASDHQKTELYRRFFPQASEFEAQAFVETYRSAETMAEFQGLLLGLGLEQDYGSWELVNTT